MERAKSRRDSRFSRVLERNYEVEGLLSRRALAIIEEYHPGWPSRSLVPDRCFLSIDGWMDGY